MAAPTASLANALRKAIPFEPAPQTTALRPAAEKGKTGMIVSDLDGDGDLCLVSIAWQQFTHVHL